MASVSDTYIENRERIQPNDVNNYGSAHGGNVVKLMDEVGAMSAMRHAGETCVTARIDSLSFDRPIPQGEICVIDAYAYEVGKTSIKVRLQAYREDPKTGEREQTTDSYFVFVAVDENMKPTPVPELTVDTERCRELRDAALDDEQDH
jgi:uncharacterized protein (TIGR00369 family)